VHQYPLLRRFFPPFLPLRTKYDDSIAGDAGRLNGLKHSWETLNAAFAPRTVVVQPYSRSSELKSVTWAMKRR